MKRKRDSASSSSRKDVTFDRSLTGNDCYDEIAQRHDEDSIRHSWMTNRTFIHGTSKGDDDTSSLPEGCAKPDEIKSLGRQLIRVKRKLWPAAEKCAEAWNSTASEEFSSARSFANPMEALGESRNGGLNQMFINRSAIKLANIDAILEQGLTTKSRSVANDSGGGELFLFADLCGAPGGFSEYITKRMRANGKGCHCKGYGMSLVGKNRHGTGATWCMEAFSEVNATSTIDYKVHYGNDGTGDIYKWKNVTRFRFDIDEDLEVAGIDQLKMNLVVADGGFDKQRNSERQEGLSQKLVLCELAASLELLEIGGTLVAKLFGFQTDAIRMAMRSMYHCFDSMELIKPISSRPASSERYVVFNCFKGRPHNWEGGPSWISSVLDGKCLQEDDESYYLSRVDRYIDQFDRDMMVLNLRACFSILSRLEQKTAAAEQKHSSGEKREFERERKNIDIKRYKHAWQLFI